MQRRSLPSFCRQIRRREAYLPYSLFNPQRKQPKPNHYSYLLFFPSTFSRPSRSKPKSATACWRRYEAPRRRCRRKTSSSKRKQALIDRFLRSTRRSRRRTGSCREKEMRGATICAMRLCLDRRTSACRDHDEG